MGILRTRLAAAPIPLAGLALSIASLGWCWEYAGDFAGNAKLSGATIAAVLLVILLARFILHPKLLLSDLAHPVTGSVVPTFAMATMLVSHAIGGTAGTLIWSVAVLLHLGFLVIFFRYRFADFQLSHMVPSWFIPPIGIVVAALCHPNNPALAGLVDGLLWFGMAAYGIMLPLMLYRLIFAEEIPDAAKPTIAILAAPASLVLAGYLAVTPAPSTLLVSLLLGLAFLMTLLIYLSFFTLLRLEFSPAYAAFTFPMVIGATAVFKARQYFLANFDGMYQLGEVLQLIANIELLVATAIVFYVAVGYLRFFKLLPLPFLHLQK